MYNIYTRWVIQRNSQLIRVRIQSLGSGVVFWVIIININMIGSFKVDECRKVLQYLSQDFLQMMHITTIFIFRKTISLYIVQI